MVSSKWVPVFREELEEATLLMAYLRSDGIAVKIVPDVKSPPLRDPTAHNLKSQYTLHVLLVPAAEEERALEVIAAYQAEEGEE